MISKTVNSIQKGHMCTSYRAKWFYSLPFQLFPI